MALTDSLILQVYPVAGETAIKNIVDDSEFTGTGTPTIVDVVGEDAWQVSTGTLLDCVIPSKTVDGSIDGSGITLAVRLQLTANGTDDFLNLLGIHNSASAISTGARFLRAGSGTYRGRLNTDLTATQGGLVTANVLTLVYRARISSASAQDYGDLWVQTTGRVGTDPDTTSIAANIFSTTFNRFFLNCQSNAQYNLLDVAYWDRELTNEEAASVADNYRSVMPSASGGVPVNSSISFEALQPSFSVDTTQTQPPQPINSSIAFDIPEPVFSITSEVTMPGATLTTSGQDILKAWNNGVVETLNGVSVDIAICSTDFSSVLDTLTNVTVTAGYISEASSNLSPSTEYLCFFKYNSTWSEGVLLTTEA